MGRRRQGGRLKAYENVEVIDAGAKGKAVARVDDKVVFITGAVPGDVCDIQVTKKKKSFLTYSQKNWLFRMHVVFLEVRRSLTVGIIRRPTDRP